MKRLMGILLFVILLVSFTLSLADEPAVPETMTRETEIVGEIRPMFLLAASSADVSWTSSDPSVAEAAAVDGQPDKVIVKSLKAGSTVIIARAEDGNEVLHCDLTVTEKAGEGVPVTGSRSRRYRSRSMPPRLAHRRSGLPPPPRPVIR